MIIVYNINYRGKVFVMFARNAHRHKQYLIEKSRVYGRTL